MQFFLCPDITEVSKTCSIGSVLREIPGPLSDIHSNSEQRTLLSLLVKHPGCTGDGYSVVGRVINIYYEQQINREVKRIHISGCRYNERLKAKTDGSKCLGYTGFPGDVEHLTIETKLIGESFEFVMGCLL